ncbi:MAG: hypothetical protein EON93_22395, partial [Burkholderiales bacterium]
MKKLLAEFLGTAVLVLFGCGSAVLAGADIVGQLGISFAFGLSIVAMAYGIGPISGCHINPAVSFGAYLAGRMNVNEMVQYWVAQFLGALVGAGILYAIASGKAGYDIAVNGLGQNGFGDAYLGGYSMTAALTFEIVATFIFVVVILGGSALVAPAWAIAPRHWLGTDPLGRDVLAELVYGAQQLVSFSLPAMGLATLERTRSRLGESDEASMMMAIQIM